MSPYFITAHRSITDYITVIVMTIIIISSTTIPNATDLKTKIVFKYILLIQYNTMQAEMNFSFFFLLLKTYS